MTYKIGGDIIYFFLEPATICFAIPLYKKREVLVKHWHRIIGGIGIGTVVALLIILTFAKLAQFANDVIFCQYVPQAATTAIALSISWYRWYKRINIISSYFKWCHYLCPRNKFLKLFELLTLLPED